MGALGALFWAGLQQHHPEVAFEGAGRIAMAMASEGRGEELQAKIVEAIALAFPKAKEGASGAANPQSAEAPPSTSSVT